MKGLKKLSLNKKGNDYIVGDIHGCYSLLMNKLYSINFDFENDRLISVGDIIDRGAESFRCLSLLDEKWFHMVLGNHEEMMINCTIKGVRDNGMWHEFGGKWELQYDNLASYAEYMDYTLPYGIEIERSDGKKIGVVHAELGSESWDYNC